MSYAATELETIGTQILDLRQLWTDLAAKGKHAEATGVENEIAALERSAARYEVQRQAERTENARLRAVQAAESMRERIEKHRNSRVELEGVVAEIEAAAKVVAVAWERLRPAWSNCISTYPSWQKFDDPAQQEAYNEALGADKWPQFDPLRLRLRLPLVLDILRQHGNRGLNEILQSADARF